MFGIVDADMLEVCLEKSFAELALVLRDVYDWKQVRLKELSLRTLAW